MTRRRPDPLAPLRSASGITTAMGLRLDSTQPCPPCQAEGAPTPCTKRVSKPSTGPLRNDAALQVQIIDKNGRGKTRAQLEAELDKRLDEIIRSNKRYKLLRKC